MSPYKNDNNEAAQYVNKNKVLKCNVKKKLRAYSFSDTDDGHIDNDQIDINCYSDCRYVNNYLDVPIINNKHKKSRSYTLNYLDTNTTNNTFDHRTNNENFLQSYNYNNEVYYSANDDESIQLDYSSFETSYNDYQNSNLQYGALFNYTHQPDFHNNNDDYNNTLFDLNSYNDNNNNSINFEFKVTNCNDMYSDITTTQNIDFDNGEYANESNHDSINENQIIANSHLSSITTLANYSQNNDEEYLACCTQLSSIVIHYLSKFKQQDQLSNSYGYMSMKKIDQSIYILESINYDYLEEILPDSSLRGWQKYSSRLADSSKYNKEVATTTTVTCQKLRMHKNHEYKIVSYYDVYEFLFTFIRICKYINVECKHMGENCFVCSFIGMLYYTTRLDELVLQIPGYEKEVSIGVELSRILFDAQYIETNKITNEEIFNDYLNLLQCVINNLNYYVNKVMKLIFPDLHLFSRQPTYKPMFTHSKLYTALEEEDKHLMLYYEKPCTLMIPWESYGLLN